MGHVHSLQTKQYLRFDWHWLLSQHLKSRDFSAEDDGDEHEEKHNSLHVGGGGMGVRTDRDFVCSIQLNIMQRRSDTVPRSRTVQPLCRDDLTLYLEAGQLNP